MFFQHVPARRQEFILLPDELLQVKLDLLNALRTDKPLKHVSCVSGTSCTTS